MRAQRLGTAALAALLGLGLPAAVTAQQAPAVPAQSAPAADTQFTTVQSVLARQAQNTQTLASMQNQISSRDITLVPINGLGWNATQRSMLDARTTGDGWRALQDAMGKATVADVNRNNGQSPDQSSLAEYVKHMGVDPHSVVAVDVQQNDDPNNPHVLVFYRARVNNPAPNGNGG